MSFPSLGLSEPLLRATTEHGYVDPTPVQQAVIPVVLAGSDVWAQATTGSGKTAAFVLPLLERLARTELTLPRAVRVLIVVPTRELAKQTADTIAALRRHLRQRPKAVVVLGGVSINPQMMALRGGAEIVIATPGRLLDLVANNALSLGAVAHLVLDEADRLLAQGFRDELERIVALVPARRQTLLFSATLPPAVDSLAQRLLRAPVRIDVSDAPAALPAITQRAIEVDAARRTQLLRHLLAEHGWPRALVFVATTHASEHVATKLQGAGINAIALHGELRQGARTRALDLFRASGVQVLVATDLASRGLDITGLPAVINYDLPRSPDDHLHRIGRTGRAGEPGTAISFITADQHAHFRLIEKRHQRYIVRERVPGFEPTQAPIAPASTGGIKGRRPSKKDKRRAAAARGEKP